MKLFLTFILISTGIGLAIHFAIPQLEILHVAIYGLNIASLLVLILGLGSRIVFLEFLAFQAITLWLSVPLIIYDLGYDKFVVPNLFGSDILAIDKETYYHWALPATLAMILGLFLFKIKTSSLSAYLQKLEVYLGTINPNTPKILFGIGFVSIVLGKFVPGSLGFLFFLLSQLTFISVLYCVFGRFSYSKWIYGGTLLVSLQGVASGGMFGELVWWGLIIAIYGLLKLKWSFIKKALLLTLSVFLMNILQIVKGEYRALTWSKKGGEKAGISTLGKTVLKSANDNERSKSTAFAWMLIYRLNHAHTVSRVMKFVPKNEPYANGEIVFTSIVASFVPRLLWPNKPKSGGRENIVRFAKHKPHGGASYDIGQIGDAWANFGYWGGIIFLFLFGAFNSWLLKWLVEISAKSYPTLIIWIPIVFLQLLKVEVSVVTIFNAAIKGVFFVILVFWITNKMKVKI